MECADIRTVDKGFLPVMAFSKTGKDLELLQGRWELVGIEADGITDPSGGNFVFVAAGGGSVSKPADYCTETGQTLRRFVRRARRA